MVDKPKIESKINVFIEGPKCNRKCGELFRKASEKCFK